jgi:hypothetical protein
MKKMSYEESGALGTQQSVELTGSLKQEASIVVSGSVNLRTLPFGQ